MKKTQLLTLLTLLMVWAIISLPANAQMTEVTSSWVNSNGAPAMADSEGNEIPDFSHVGYMRGEEPIPDGSGWSTITVFPTCSGTHQFCLTGSTNDADDINDAISSCTSGNCVIQLTQGNYYLKESILIDRSNVILRGSSPPSYPTLIYTYGVANFNGRDSFALDWEKWAIQMGARQINGSPNDNAWFQGRDGSSITNLAQTANVGDNSIRVPSGSGFSAEDRILIEQETNSQQWKNDMNWCGDTPCPGSHNISRDITYMRRLESVTPSGNEDILTFYSPLFYRLNTIYSPQVSRVSETIYDQHTVSNIGIEDINLIIKAPGCESGCTSGHPGTGIQFYATENAWARNISVSGYSQHAVETTYASQVTIDNVRAYLPNWENASGLPRPYTFSVGGFSQLILVKDSFASDSHLAFSVNGTFLANGIVFLRNVGFNTNTVGAESHQGFAVGILWDNHREANIDITNDSVPDDLFIARTAYIDDLFGWQSGNTVFWNFNGGITDRTYDQNGQNVGLHSRVLLAQKPPTAQNWVIGSSNEATHIDPRFTTGSETPAVQEHDNTTNQSHSIVKVGSTYSLYEAQLDGRGLEPETEVTYLSDLNWTSVVKKEGYWRGPEKDRSTYFTTIKLGDTYYAKGIGVAGSTKITYTLNGQYDTFKADLGLPDETFDDKPSGCTTCATMDFKILVDGVVKYDSYQIRGAVTEPRMPTMYANVDVRGAQTLTIEVTDGGDGINTDHAVWADARLLSTQDPGGLYAKHSTASTLQSENKLSETVQSFALEQNYPNPFNPTTEIQFSIAKRVEVTLDVFDVMGRKIATLHDGMLNSGKHSVSWNAAEMPSGMYYYRLQAGDFTKTQSMILMK